MVIHQHRILALLRKSMLIHMLACMNLEDASSSSTPLSSFKTRSLGAVISALTQRLESKCARKSGKKQETRHTPLPQLQDQWSDLPGQYALISNLSKCGHPMLYKKCQWVLSQGVRSSAEGSFGFNVPYPLVRP